MFFQPSESQLAQTLAAIAPIEAALARFHSPASTLDRDRLAGGELMTLIDAHARLFHTLLRAEIAAIESAGEAALAPFAADSHARGKIISGFDFIFRFQHLRDGLSAGPATADSLLRKALSLFRDFTNAAELSNP